MSALVSPIRRPRLFGLRSASPVTFIVWILTLMVCQTQAADVTVFAAASLTDSLTEIARGYEKQSRDRIYFNFGTSSLLARQIAEGSPADIFFSADEAKMNDLEYNGLLVANTRFSRLSNSLAIVVPVNSSIVLKSVRDLTNTAIERIALADPKTVPAGIYARDYLNSQRLWGALESKVIPTDNVRAALAAVESGDVEAGIVYKTDAAISKKIKVALQIPPGEGPPISYPMAIVRSTQQLEAARRFLDYLNSAEAGRIFQKYEFTIGGKGN